MHLKLANAAGVPANGIQEVLPGIFMGRRKDGEDMESLKAEGFTHVVSCQARRLSACCPGISYLIFNKAERGESHSAMPQNPLPHLQ